MLYAGLMIEDGAPKLIEYNVRFGDPECQVLMLRLKSDLLPALIAAADGRLGGIELEWFDRACAVRGDGRPGLSRTPMPRAPRSTASRDAASDPGVEIFHAGTKRDGARILADGGRVLGVTARGRDIEEARARAYRAVDKIDWPEGFCRRDIGWRAMARE